MALSREEIFEQIQDLTAKKLYLEKSEITLESDFVKDLGADSLDLVELVISFEQTFKVKIPDDEGSQVFVVKDAVDLVENLNQA
jgi:acyl carrier protein